MGSASELDYHLLLCRDLGIMSGDDFTSSAAQLTEVRKMLTSFLNSVEDQIDLRSTGVERT
jgi:four helix bundle protein